MLKSSRPSFGSSLQLLGYFKGSIAVGKAADFTVFDKNIMEIPEDEILQTKVQMTVVGGKVVYQKK